MTRIDDIREAFWVYALDTSNFRIARALLNTGWTPRATLARYRDLSEPAQRLYDAIVARRGQKIHPNSLRPSQGHQHANSWHTAIGR